MYGFRRAASANIRTPRQYQIKSVNTKLGKPNKFKPINPTQLIIPKNFTGTFAHITEQFNVQTHKPNPNPTVENGLVHMIGFLVAASLIIGLWAWLTKYFREHALVVTVFILILIMLAAV